MPSSARREQNLTHQRKRARCISKGLCARMAPQHVFATAHGLTSYLKYQKGFGRKTKRRPRSGTDTAAEPLLSSRHNSGALETVRVAESTRVHGTAYRATSCCERRPSGNELRVGRMSALAISRFVMSVTDHMIASCM